MVYSKKPSNKPKKPSYKPKKRMQPKRLQARGPLRQHGLQRTRSKQESSLEPKPSWNCKIWPYLELCKNYLFCWGEPCQKVQCVQPKKKKRTICRRTLYPKKYAPKRLTRKPKPRPMTKKAKLNKLVNLINEMMECVNEEEKQTKKRRKQLPTTSKRSSVSLKELASQDSLQSVLSHESITKKKPAKSNKRKRGSVHSMPKKRAKRERDPSVGMSDDDFSSTDED